MGWWKIGKNGGIAGLMDAPRENPAEKDMVNGDGPADLISDFLDEYGDKIQKDQLIALLTYTSPRNSANLQPQMLSDVVVLRTALEKEWNQNWQRLPFTVEIEAAVEFCWR